jgi:hypothetical protein
MTVPSPTAAVAEASEPRSRSRASWPWIVVALILGFGKTEGFRLLEHHVWGWAVVLGVTSGWSLIRARPVLTALLAAPAFSLLLTPHPLGLAVAVGFGTFVVLIALFVAIGTVLRTLDSRREPRHTVAQTSGT